MIISKKIKLQRLYETSVIVLSLSFILYLIIFSDTAIKGAGDGLDICLHVIFVSVFPFSVAARLFTASGCAEIIGRFLGKPMQKLLGISPQGAGAVIIGAVGGFPTGAGVCSELFKNGNIDKKEAERLISYTNNATPAFIISYAGSCIGSAKAGILCYVCIMISSLIWGFVIRCKAMIINNDKISFDKKNFPFVKATAESAISTVVICGFIIIFSVITSAFSAFTRDPVIIAALTSVFEITSGIRNISFIGTGVVDGALICGVTSFSGLCVFAQVKAECVSAGLSCKYYLPGKLFQAVLSFLFFYLLYPLIFYR